jgi:hypothetical protein
MEAIGHLISWPSPNQGVAHGEGRQAGNSPHSSAETVNPHFNDDVKPDIMIMPHEKKRKAIL